MHAKAQIAIKFDRAKSIPFGSLVDFVGHNITVVSGAFSLPKCIGHRVIGLVQSKLNGHGAGLEWGWIKSGVYRKSVYQVGGVRVKGYLSHTKK